MKWFYDLKISKKLLIGFILVAVVAGIIGAVGIVNILTIAKSDQELFENNTMAVGDTGVIVADYEKITILMRELLVDKTDSEKKVHFNQLQSIENQLKTEVDDIKKYVNSAEETKAYDGLKTALANFETIKTKVVDLELKEQDDQAISLLRGDGESTASAVDDAVQNMRDLELKVAKQQSENNMATGDRAIITMIGFMVGGIVLAIGLGIFISLIISKPLNKLVEAAGKIAEGDLNVEVKVETRDEVGILTEAFDRMASNTNEVMTNIRDAAEQVAVGSKQVSLSSQSLSQGSTEQASSLEEITSSITEIAAQTRQNAVNANQANQLTGSVKEKALEGNEQMKGMLGAMEEINEASESISKIIKVIDEIAFQTNILALNAAVEAARAGQHGKGFAVVAEEVRNLAARSANAAKETTSLIEGSMKKVEIGTKMANETAVALNRIVEGVAGTTTLVAEIANASNQQASAITQVNVGIEQVSQVTQTNTATAEEAAAASEELAGQAEILKGMVGKFKIKNIPLTNTYFKGITPEMLKAIESFVEKKNTGYTRHIENNITEAAATASKSKVNINLDDSEFDKY